MVSFGDTVREFGVITSRIFIGAVSSATYVRKNTAALAFAVHRYRASRSTQRIDREHLHAVQRDILRSADHVGHWTCAARVAHVDGVKDLPRLAVEHHQAAIAGEKHESGNGREQPRRATRIR